MKLVLVGMPASGKSTLGKQLAEKYNYNFIDLDDFIEEIEEESIADIFKNKGEDYFRQAEQKALHQALEFEKTILATGGGTPCFFDNMDYINQNGTSIYLKVSIEELVKHIWESQSPHRPLYNTQNPEDLKSILTKTYEKRRVFYERAKIII